MRLLRPENDGSQGEFSGGFGTTSNPATQIFKEGGFKRPNKTKWVIIIGAIIVALAVGFYFYTSNPDNIDNLEKTIFEDSASPKEDDHAKEAKLPENHEKVAAHKEGAEEKNPLNDGVKKDPFKEKDLAENETEESDDAGDQSKAENKKEEEIIPAASAAAVLLSPEDGHSRFYDETSPAPEFTWKGSKGDSILFSRSPTMKPVISKMKTNGKNFSFRQAQPGTWYWRVDNSAGQSSVRSFIIKPAIKRNIQLTSPANGSSLSGNGGVVSWTGDAKVIHYRVELTTSDWAAPLKFSTAGTQTSIQGVKPGSYQMRVGGISEVSGKMEYTDPITVKVE